MKITLGNYEVVASGYVIQIENNPIKVVLADEIEGDFTFTFIFNTAAGNPQPHINVKGVDQFHIEIELLNFNNQISVGNSVALPLGTLRRLPLFLNYRISDLPGSGKSLLFNFYTKEEAKNVN